VVINACQMADGGSLDSPAVTDFASAIVRAGARHVIAAQWPVSDSASAVWIPAFYGSIAANAAIAPGEALRNARLALRRSRAYRHPFYWAGWVHIAAQVTSE
jgi:CHAT domain-containing protein